MTKVINCYRAESGQLKQTKKISLKVFNAGLMLVIAGLGIFHLLNVSDLTAKGFALKELKAQASILASANLDSEERINSLQSYYSLNSRTEKLNMVAIGEIDYLSAPGAFFARK